MFRVGSLFSGAGGFDIGFKQAGFSTVWGSEIMPEPRSIFRKNITREIYHDVTKIQGRGLEAVDVLIFGSPCQDLSTQGRRGGIEGERSSLFFEAMRIVDEMGEKPKVVVWENVKGALLSNKGRDFGRVLYEVAKRWSGVSYRVLNLRLFGRPQQRRRVFVVGCSFGWESAGEVLFDREAQGKDSILQEKEQKEVFREVDECFEDIKIYDAQAMNEKDWAGTLYSSPRTSFVGGESCGFCLRVGSTLRSLTPIECERLMGWPDDYTRFGLDDNDDVVEISDRKRYEMIGNGVGGNVSEWIANRIKGVLHNA